MSTTPRRKFKSDFKAKVAIESIREQKTIEEICKKYEVHPTKVNLWEKKFLAKTLKLFDKEKAVVSENDSDKKLQNLYAQKEPLVFTNGSFS